jgi:paraquat-inducible protein A
MNASRLAMPIATAASMRLLSCHACGLLSTHALEGLHCPRCGTALHRRKPDSLVRSWAFLIAAVILYIPANLLPMMSAQSILGTSHDTILSGIVYFWISGSKALAMLVLTASVVVPLLKMMALTMLLLSVHFRCTWRIRQQTRLYRLLEMIGRWSMLDIFVVAMLAALVRAGKLATITPGPGTLAFAAVVVLTMLASLSFDSRLLWDALDANND